MFIPYKQPYNRIQVIRANAVSDFRMDLLQRRLVREGYDSEIITAVPFHKASQFDTVICCRPGDSMLDYLRICQVAGKRVVIDFDDDFNSIPKHNPAYPYTGAGHPTYLNKLKQTLSAPGMLVTYASPELANRYHIAGTVIPNCYDEENELWGLPKCTAPGRLTLGWSGTTTHREDFKIIAPVIKRILNAYDHVDIAISLDDQIYNDFLSFPEDRKIYLPGVPYDIYPAIFAWFDIMVIPLRDTYFNRAKSDIKMVECGASRTAYIASDMPVYHEWAAGGLTVPNDEESWEAALRNLIENEELRGSLVAAGHEKALTRTSKLYTDKWLAFIEEINENPVP